MTYNVFGGMLNPTETMTAITVTVYMMMMMMMMMYIGHLVARRSVSNVTQQSLTAPTQQR